MSCYGGPEITNDGLVLYYDMNNTKSLPYHPGNADHGISDWYCFVSGTATYSASESNTIIYQITDLGVVSTIVSATTPQRGTFAITAGYRYYGNKPIFLTVEDAQHSIAPLSLNGTVFIYAAQRAGSEAGTVYFYSLYDSTTITMYKGSTGVNGVANSTISLTKGTQGTFSISVLDFYYFTSTNPVIGSATQINADKTVLSPAKSTSYTRYQSYTLTSINTTPTTVGAYLVYDTTYPVMGQSIADGSGGDTAQGLAYENLCDSYSWGNVLSDYVIVSPYPNTNIATYYWNGSAWVIWDKHSLSGSMLSPVAVSRDGTTGSGNTSTIISGLANNMVSDTTTLWKWEGNNPFYLCINDSADDELSLLGWTSTRKSRTTSDLDNIIYDTSNTGNNGTMVNKILTNSLFDGANDYINVTNTSSLQFLGTLPYTLEAWVYPTANPGASNWTGIFDREYNVGLGRDGYNMYFLGSAGTSTYFVTERFCSGVNTNVSVTLDQSVSVNNWSYLVATYDGSNLKLYRNGTLQSSVASANNITNATTNLTIGKRNTNYFNGKISLAKVYNTALSVDQVTQNFNATRGRYGI